MHQKLVFKAYMIFFNLTGVYMKFILFFSFHFMTQNDDTY